MYSKYWSFNRYLKVFLYCTRSALRSRIYLSITYFQTFLKENRLFSLFRQKECLPLRNNWIDCKAQVIWSNCYFDTTVTPPVPYFLYPSPSVTKQAILVNKEIRLAKQAIIKTVLASTWAIFERPGYQGTYFAKIWEKIGKLLKLVIETTVSIKKSHCTIESI